MPEPASEQSVFLNALALPTPAERAAYLDEACRDNPGLRAEVEALLAAHERLASGPYCPAGTTCSNRSAKGAWAPSGWHSRSSRSSDWWR